MVSSGMLHRVALVRTGVSEELSASFIMVFLRSVRRLLVTASVVPSSQILVTLIKEELNSYETSVLTRATRRNISTPFYPQKLALNFVDKWRSLSRYSSLAD
jgi:hypothetical protein